MAPQQDTSGNHSTAEPSEWLSALLTLFPAFVTTGYAIIGTAFLGWKASDVFFWFWCEMMTVLLIGVVLALLWARGGTNRIPQPFAAVYACLLIILFGTMFSVLSFGEQQPLRLRAEIGQLIAERRVQLVLLVLSFILSTWRRVTGGRLMAMEWRQIEAPVLRYAWPILFLYGVTILHYHFTGSRSLDLTKPYVKGMALVLLAAKFFFELKRWLRSFRVSKKAAGVDGGAPR